LFSTEKFIEASRDFVCIRVETYESKRSEAMVRQLLRGKFENTSMAIFNPDGTEQLTRGARSPEQVFSERPGPGEQADSATIIG